MNDFVNIRKKLTDETPGFSHCEKTRFVSIGEKYTTQHYKLKKQFTDIGIIMNEATGELTVKGNLGMFWNGHNINFPFDDMRNSIEYISDSLRVDLFPADVKEFDHSAVIQTDLIPIEVFQKHISLPGHERVQQKHGLYFNKPGTQIVKLYDAAMRLKQLNSNANRVEILNSLGIDHMQRLLRVEKKILHPSRYFKRPVSVNDLLHPNFIELCNIDLIETYGSMKKIRSMNQPKNKKDLTAATIPLIVVKELEDQHGFDLEALLKKKIASFPESLLSRNDKKARKRQIKANLNKISNSLSNEYDLTDSLVKSLKLDSEPIKTKQATPFYITY